MIVRGKGFSGATEVHFKDFAEVVPEVQKVRDRFREKKQGATEKQLEDLKAKVQLWCERHFGSVRFNQDWREAFGTDESALPNAIVRWGEWLDAKPLSYRKVYYSPQVVAACVMSEEE